MLIVSLPPVHQEKLLKEICEHPLVEAVRYNTGVDSAYPPRETLERILRCLPQGKPLYVDLKGKQLRIQEWASPPFGPIVLNHKIRVELPGKVFFRGDDCCELKEVVNGNIIYVDPPPEYAVGKGQSINILAKQLKIEGWLTDNDWAYIQAAKDLGVSRFMLSFVESWDDALALQKILTENSEIVLKIESQAGMDFVKSADPTLLSQYQLMAARDDLMIQIGGLAIPDALRSIIVKDPKAICASRLLLGLEQNGEVTMADISDILLMKSWGYKRFMLSDGISRKHFAKAIQFWEKLSLT